MAESCGDDHLRLTRTPQQDLAWLIIPSFPNSFSPWLSGYLTFVVLLLTHWTHLFGLWSLWLGSSLLDISIPENSILNLLSTVLFQVIYNPTF